MAFSLWAETYDRKLDDVLDIQGAIAREVVAALAPLMQLYQEASKPVAVDAVLTRDAEAYRAYLRGVYLFTRWIDRDPQSARTEFLRAVERDPEFAKAYAMLARTYQLSADLAIGDVAQSKSLACSRTGQGDETRPTIGDLWWVRLMFVAGDDAPIAVRASDLERAVAANPTEIEPMLWLAHTYLALARRDEALQIFERAYALDPLSPAALWKAAWFGYEFAGARQRLLDRTGELERLLPHDPKSSQIACMACFQRRPCARLGQVRRQGRSNSIPRNQPNHCYLAADYEFLGGVYDAAMYHAQMCSKLNPGTWRGCSTSRASSCSPAISRPLATQCRKPWRRIPRTVLPSSPRAELQYFTGDCAGALRSIAQARPALNRPEGALDLFHNRRRRRHFRLVPAPAGQLGARRRDRAAYSTAECAAGYRGTIRRRAGAHGRRDRRPAMRWLLICGALAKTRSMGFTFVRHEPMIQPYLKDPEVVALLDKLEERRAEWRRVLPEVLDARADPGHRRRKLTAYFCLSNSRPLPFACPRMRSPGTNLPERMACASGFSTCCWMARFNGRAPYTGS